MSFFFPRRMHNRKLESYSVVFLVLAVLGTFTWTRSAAARQDSSAKPSSTSLLEGYRHVEVASVSDALEQLTGKRMYMTHRMRPIFPTKFAGYALTVKLKKEANDDPMH